MLVTQLTVVGVGLIGGSFALAARRAGLARRVTGWDRPETIELAIESGVLDSIEESLGRDEECGADLVYLATPVNDIVEFIASGKSFKPGSLVTDAGSTKREIMKAAQEHLGGVNFIGGHPMAGAHRSGIENASADLFHGAPYAIVPGDWCDPENQEFSKSLTLLVNVVRAVGGRPVLISADQHDRTVARLSHSVQLAATALTLAASKAQSDLSMSGPAFKEILRLAESPWSIWEDICRSNADEIMPCISDLIAALDSIRLALESGDFESIRNQFERAAEYINSMDGGARSGN